MGNHCAFVDCESRSQYDRHLRFFKFPRDTEVCAAWIKASGKMNVNLKYERVCSLHFTEDDWCLMHRLLNVPFLERRLDPKAVPTQNLPKQHERMEPWNQRVHKTNKKEAVEDCFIQTFEQRFLKEGNTLQFLEEDVPVDNDQFNHSDEAHPIYKSDCVEEPITEEIPRFAVLKQNHGSQITSTTKCHKNPRIEKLNDTSLLNRSHERPDLALKEHKILAITNQLQKCTEENEKLRLEYTRLLSLETSIKTIFTEGQVRKITNPKSKVIWTLDELASAIQLYSLNPVTYRHLYKKKYPFPRPSLVRLWLPKVKLAFDRKCQHGRM